MRRGFTLIELLIVITIIGILSSVVMSSVKNAKEKAKIVTTQLTIKQIRNAIVMLELDTREWPGHKTIEEIESGPGNEIWDLGVGSVGLLTNDTVTPYSNWKGPYMQSIPLDPWGNPYFFDTDYDVQPGAGTIEGVVVGSFGPNGVGQNVYDSDNIIIEFVRQ